MLKLCEHCGAEFEAVKNKRYCCEECYKAARRNRRRAAYFSRRTVTVPRACRIQGIKSCPECPKPECSY